MPLGPTRITLGRLGDGMPTNCIKARVEPPQPGSGERRRGADSSAVCRLPLSGCGAEEPPRAAPASALQRLWRTSRRTLAGGTRNGRWSIAAPDHEKIRTREAIENKIMQYRCAVTVIFAAHVWPAARRERRLDGPRLASESARAGHVPRPILRQSLPPPPALTESLLSPCDPACAGPPGDE